MARFAGHDPHELTLPERLLVSLPIPYAAACLIIALAISLPGQAFALFLDKLDFSAVYAEINSVVRVDWQRYASFALTSIITFYSLYGIRHMRTRLVAIEGDVLPILPEGESSFRDAFGLVTSNLPPVLLTALFCLYSLSRLQGLTGTFYPILVTVYFVIFYAAIAWFVWVYLASLWGLHRLGQKPLRAKSFYEDGMLGMRPLGSLSLSLSLVYFIALGPSALLITIDLPFLGAEALQYLLLLAALAMLGLVLFFLPLNGVHTMMSTEKKHEQANLRGRFARLVRDRNPNIDEASEATLADLRNLQALEMVERKVASIPTWPFDTVILSKLLVISLSVIATLVARVIIVRLGI